jgi:hypothetical protein
MITFIDDEGGDRVELFAHRDGLCVGRADHLEHHGPALEEDRVEQLVLAREVVVEQSVRDACLVRDVRDAAGVEAALGEHAHRGAENLLAPVGLPRGHPGTSLRCR